MLHLGARNCNTSEGKKYTPKVLSALKIQVPQQAKKEVWCIPKSLFSWENEENTYTPKNLQGGCWGPLRAALVYRFWPPNTDTDRDTEFNSVFIFEATVIMLRGGLKGGLTERGVFTTACQCIVSPHGRTGNRPVTSRPCKLMKHDQIAHDNRLPVHPKGPFRTKNTTTIVKIVNYYAVVFLLRPPNLVRRGPFFERKNVYNSQENGVRTRCAAIVNHPAVLKILRVVNLLRVVFLVRRGPLGLSALAFAATSYCHPGRHANVGVCPFCCKNLCSSSIFCAVVGKLGAAEP